MLLAPNFEFWRGPSISHFWSLAAFALLGVLAGHTSVHAANSPDLFVAPAPIKFSTDAGSTAYFVSIQLGGPDASATQRLINCTNRNVAAALDCPPGACEVVEAKNITRCGTSQPTSGQASTADLMNNDEALLSDFLEKSEQVEMNNSVEVKQYSIVAPAPKRHLLDDSAPSPAYVLNCSFESELTLYLTFLAGDEASRWNQTVALFSGGIYLSKMQRSGFDLENVTLLSHQELGASPQGSKAVASLIVSDQNHIPGPKPAVMNNDTTPGPVSFTIDIQGLDAQVTNDTLLTALYSLLTNTTPPNSPGARWFTPMNTVISSVIQDEQPRRRTTRRSLLQDEYAYAPVPGPGGDLCAVYGNNVVPPSLSVTIKLFQVPKSATGQVMLYVQSLVNQNVLLGAFLDSGLRICRVSLTSFTGGASTPAPAPSESPTTFVARSGSNHGVVVIALSIAIPVSIVGTALATLSLIWYRRRSRQMQEGARGVGKMRFSGESSLFGSPRSAVEPEASAQSIISQIHNDSFSSRSRLIDMPWSDWKIDPAELAILKRPDNTEWLLGSGASGRVYKAERNGVQIVAVKVFKEEATRGAITSLTSPQHAAQFKQEISILKSCHDKNIVQFLGACLTVGQTILVTEYLENGDLYKAINSQQGNRYHWYRMQLPDARPLPNSGMGRRVALDVARGLHFLHTRKIVHFDLKSANILLARDFTAKIADVGLARILHDDVLSTRKEVGTFAWAAPEVLLGQRVTEAADIYSFGVLLHELSAIESPQKRQLRQLSIPEEAPVEVADLINRCLEIDPRKRPTARELVAALSCMPVVAPYPPATVNVLAPETPQLLCPALMH